MLDIDIIDRYCFLRTSGLRERETRLGAGKQVIDVDNNMHMTVVRVV